jgi:hypothetical protein
MLAVKAMTKAQALRKLAALGWKQVEPPAGHSRPGRSYAYLRYPDSDEVGYFCPGDLLAELETRSAQRGGFAASCER